MTLTFEGTVVVPAADPDDGRRTAAALSPHLGEQGRAIVVYVVETTFEAAGDHDADAVAFVAREGNRLAELLSGDPARRLVKEAEVPVVALPEEG